MNRVHKSIKRYIPEIRNIAIKYKLLEFSLFGSSTSDLFNLNTSDLDVYIKCENDQIKCIPRIQFELQQLVKRSVDIFLNQWEINPKLMKSINLGKVIIYKKDHSKEQK